MAKTRKFKTKIIVTKMRTGPLVQRDLKNSKCIFVAVYVALLLLLSFLLCNAM